jgi:methyl-accepting chemotaxis protein
MKFQNIKLRNKIIMLAFLIIALFFLMIVFYIVPTVNDIIEDRTIVKLSELVDLPNSEILRQYELAQKGDKTTEEAQADALSVIQAMRYSGEEYFWVNDMEGQMLMHAARPELDNTSVWDMQDPDGKYIFREFIAAVKKDGRGVIHYQWPKPGEEAPQPKISFVIGFPQWNWVVGTGVYVDDLAKIKQGIFLRVVTVSVIIIIFSIVLVGLIVIPLNRTLRSIVLKTERYGKLDFQESINLQSKDELGEIARAFDSVSHGLKELLKNIIRASEELAREAGGMSQDMEILGQRTGSALLSTTDISAKIEETSNSTAHVSETVNEIKDAVEVVAIKATEGASKANDVSERATNLKQGALNSSEEARNIYGVVKARLENAIANAEQVKQINSLLESIISITNQTNLLALNASIEAARAGDAGKGFAVVATEVGKLAAESKTLVESIQKTITFIQTAVGELVGDAKAMLGFIEDNVLQDYDKLLSLGDQYSDDADAFNNIMTDLSAVAQEITSSMISIAENIQEVSNATALEADSVEHILAVNQEITEKTTNVAEILQGNIELIRELERLVGKFKI